MFPMRFSLAIGLCCFLVFREAPSASQINSSLRLSFIFHESKGPSAAD
jgi:hypothetical protein